MIEQARQNAGAYTKSLADKLRREPPETPAETGDSVGMTGYKCVGT